MPQTTPFFVESICDWDLLLLLLLRRRRARRNRSRSRRVWVRSIFRRRQEYGEFHHLLQELRLSDPENHFRYLRMSKQTFDNLLEKVSHSNFIFLYTCIHKQVSPLLTHRHWGSINRPGISPAERLALTLRFLATGNSQVWLILN